VRWTTPPRPVADPEPGTAHTGGSLRVATYNVYLGADLEPLFGAASPQALIDAAAAAYRQVERTDFRRRAPAIAEVLCRERPDVVGLQEVAHWASGPRDTAPGGLRTSSDFLPLLLAELARRRVQYDVAVRNPAFHGTAPISAAQVAQVEGHDVILVRSGRTDVTGARSGTFGARLTLHTGVPGVAFEIPRGWCSVDLRVGDVTVRVVNTHLEAWDREVRMRQAAELVAVLAPWPGPVVVLGDLNAEPGSDDAYGVLTTTPGGYVDAWRECHGAGGGATSGREASLEQPGALSRRIDYVLHRADGRLRAEAVRVVGAADADRAGHEGDEPILWPSDHAAVVADLTLGPAPGETTRTL